MNEKPKICGNCKNKYYIQCIDENGYSYYKWKCSLTDKPIYATETCEGWEANEVRNKYFNG